MILICAGLNFETCTLDTSTSFIPEIQEHISHLQHIYCMNQTSTILGQGL
jgi:hypothetical protein